MTNAETTDATLERWRAQEYKYGFYTDIAAGSHRLHADEPAGVGGTNRGPTPYGLLSAALAACTSMTN